MDQKTNKQIFIAALKYYKLTNRSNLNTLVPYNQFSFSETKNNWPILWTAALVFTCFLAMAVLCAGLFTHGKTLLSPTTDVAGKSDYGPPLILGAALLIFTYASYKYLNAIRTLWRLAQSHHFDAGFPAKIEIRKN